MKKYRLISKKGEGTFSEVLKAQSLKNGKYFAIKCMKSEFKTIEQVNNLREIQALRRLTPHPNIVNLEEVLYDGPTGRLALVFELMDMNLYELIKGRKHHLDIQLVRVYMWQLLRSLAHMHAKGIFHRDIKPENILIESNYDVYTGLKLADFGSCRGVQSKQPFTEYISTRWYRAPECLLTDGYYGKEMDVWGIGCVFFEITALTPLFPGQNEVDQVAKIHKILGGPDPSTAAFLKQHATAHMEVKFDDLKPTGFAHMLRHAPPECVDLITKLLIYDPRRRISAADALLHPFFDQLRRIPEPPGLFPAPKQQRSHEDPGPKRTTKASSKSTKAHGTSSQTSIPDPPVQVPAAAAVPVVKAPRVLEPSPSKDDDEDSYEDDFDKPEEDEATGGGGRPSVAQHSPIATSGEAGTATRQRTAGTGATGNAPRVSQHSPTSAAPRQTPPRHPAAPQASPSQASVDGQARATRLVKHHHHTQSQTHPHPNRHGHQSMTQLTPHNLAAGDAAARAAHKHYRSATLELLPSVQAAQLSPRSAAAHKKLERQRQRRLPKVGPGSQSTQTLNQAKRRVTQRTYHLSHPRNQGSTASLHHADQPSLTGSTASLYSVHGQSGPHKPAGGGGSHAQRYEQPHRSNMRRRTKSKAKRTYHLGASSQSRHQSAAMSGLSGQGYQAQYSRQGPAGIAAAARHQLQVSGTYV